MKLNKSKGNMKNYKNKDWLIYNYHTLGKTMMDMCNISDCCYVTLWVWMNKFGIERRKINKIRKLPAVNRIKISDKNKNIIIGLLLGDGSLSLTPSKRSAYYEHGDKRHDFIVWLKYLFDKMGFIQSGRVYYMNVKNGAYKYKTISYLELALIYDEIYPGGKKQIPIDLKIKPDILKYWYIGDGNCTENPLIDSSIFSDRGMGNISNQLNSIGISNKLHIYSDRKRIFISNKSRNRFFDYVLSDDKEVPDCYKYKFKYRET